MGDHSESFAMSLRAALREDPDIVMIGELRDMETISISISAAETGHLVFGTLHTASAPRTISRILDVYPSSQRGQIAVMISESIRGILSQQLIPRKDKNGMVLAMEILVVTSGASALIKDQRLYQLPSIMQAGKRAGMVVMDDALAALYQAGTISGKEAYVRADNKQPYERHKDDEE